MKTISTKYMPLVIAGLLGLCLSGCSPVAGLEKLVVDGTEIYFDGETVNKEDATRLGSVLKASEFTDGSRKSIKLDKENEVWQFSMIVAEEGLEDDPEYSNAIRTMCLELSAGFDGEPFQIHICDEQLKSRKGVSGLSGKREKFGQVELYFSVADETKEKFKQYLEAKGFGDQATTFYLGKNGDNLMISMVVQDEFFDDEEFKESIEELVKDISSTVYGGGTVEYHLCNEWLQSQTKIVGTAD